MPQLFEYMKMPKKFHAIWKYQNGTCFTKLHSDQKHGKIAQGKWFSEMGQNWVEGVDMDRGMPWKICSLNEEI